MTKKKKTVVKKLTYTMTKEVVVAIEELMKNEGYSTIHKTIDACILDRSRLLKALREEDSASNKLFHEKMEMEDQITTFIKCIRRMDFIVGSNKNK